MSLPAPLVEWLTAHGIAPCTLQDLGMTQFFQVYLLKVCLSLSSTKPVPQLSALLPAASSVQYNWDIVFKALSIVGYAVTREHEHRLRDAGQGPSPLFEDLLISFHKWCVGRSSKRVLPPSGAHHSNAVHVSPAERKATTAFCRAIVNDFIVAPAIRTVLPTLSLEPPAPSKKGGIQSQSRHHMPFAQQLVWGIVDKALTNAVKDDSSTNISAFDAHHRRITQAKSHEWRQRQREIDAKNKKFEAQKEVLHDMLAKLRAEKAEQDRKMLEQLKAQEARVRATLEKQRQKDELAKQQRAELVEEYRVRQKQEAAQRVAKAAQDEERKRLDNEERVRRYREKKALEEQQKNELRERHIDPIEVARDIFRKDTRSTLDLTSSDVLLTTLEQEVITMLFNVITSPSKHAPFAADFDTRTFLTREAAKEGFTPPKVSLPLMFCATHMAWDVASSNVPSRKLLDSTWKRYGRPEKSLTRTEIITMFPPEPPSARHIVYGILSDSNLRSDLFTLTIEHSAIGVCIVPKPEATVLVLLTCNKYGTRLTVPELVNSFVSVFPQGCPEMLHLPPLGVATKQQQRQSTLTTSDSSASLPGAPKPPTQLVTVCSSWKETVREGKRVLYKASMGRGLVKGDPFVVMRVDDDHIPLPALNNNNNNNVRHEKDQATHHKTPKTNGKHLARSSSVEPKISRRVLEDKMDATPVSRTPAPTMPSELLVTQQQEEGRGSDSAPLDPVTALDRRQARREAKKRRAGSGNVDGGLGDGAVALPEPSCADDMFQPDVHIVA
eukprot:PhM_4_TR2187/c0_g1_i1/m.98065